jgi:hypothetical protein
MLLSIYQFHILTQLPSVLQNGINEILALPEFNLFVFAFLLNFVYEVWQSPFYEFYEAPALADKVRAITRCTLGDATIAVVCSLIVSAILRSRQWIISPSTAAIVWFTALPWLYTLFAEIYRTRIAKMYGVRGLVVPGLKISAFPLIQWLILPSFILWFSRYQILGQQM